MADTPAPIKRNILNEPHITESLQFFVKDQPQSIKDWFGGILRNWVLTNKTGALVVDEAVTKLPWFQHFAYQHTQSDKWVAKNGTRHSICPEVAARALTHKNQYIVVPIALCPEWAQKAYANGEGLLHLKFADAEYRQFMHWVDYFVGETDTTKPIKHSVAEVKHLVAAWDRMLESKRVKGKMSAGVKHFPVPELDGKTKFYVVELIEKIAYQNEGAIMKHCVGRLGYYDRRSPTNKIFSLRSHDESYGGVPVATIEVRKTSGAWLVIQVQASKDENGGIKYLAPEETAAVEAFKAHFGIGKSGTKARGLSRTERLYAAHYPDIALEELFEREIGDRMREELNARARQRIVREQVLASDITPVYVPDSEVGTLYLNSATQRMCVNTGNPTDPQPVLDQLSQIGNAPTMTVQVDPSGRQVMDIETYPPVSNINLEPVYGTLPSVAEVVSEFEAQEAAAGLADLGLSRSDAATPTMIMRRLKARAARAAGSAERLTTQPGGFVYQISTPSGTRRRLYDDITAETGPGA